MPLSTIFQLYRAGSVRQFHCIADYNVALEGTHHYKLRKEIDWSVVMKMFPRGGKFIPADYCSSTLPLRTCNLIPLEQWRHQHHHRHHHHHFIRK
jgi:hypothetical protein